jgi:hypothetical protein
MKTIISICILLLPLFAYGQTADTIGLKPHVYERILNQQFSGLITGQAKNSVGNFASLDLKDAEVSLAGNVIFKGGSVLGFKASGGVTDGLFDIFSNSKLNTKVSFDLQWNILRLGGRSIQYYDGSYRQYQKKERKIRAESAARIFKLEHGLVRDSLVLKQNEFNNELRKLDSQINMLRDSNGNIPQINQRKYDSLSYIQTATRVLLNSTADEISRYSEDNLVNDAHNSRARLLRNLETGIEIYGFSFGWFSFGYKIQNDAFKYFKPSELYANQVEKKNYLSHELRIQYSYYSYSKSAFESFYGDIGIAPKIINNMNELEKIEISESELVAIGATQRSVTSKYDAYKGEYKENILGLRFYANAYYFLFKNNLAAVHIYPEVNVKEGYKPISNCGFGFLLSFKDAKDATSVINTELYYNFIDVFDAKDSAYDFIERNNIGLRFIFPIKFLNK